MAEPELKLRSSRESVSKAEVSREKMEGKYSSRSHACKQHMVQSCIIPPRALMQPCLMQDSNCRVDELCSDLCVMLTGIGHFTIREIPKKN